MDRLKSLIDKKICSAEQAVALIGNGQTVASGGFVGIGVCEALACALEKRFLETGEPKNLTLVYGAGQGDGGERGANHFAHKGLLKRVIGGHWGLAPKLGKLAIDGDIEAYNFPQGVICQLFRDIAAKRPGNITHVGIGTFIDPEAMGGKLNKKTSEELVKSLILDGQRWLWYKSFPIHIGFIRATAADPFGNLIMNKEAIFGEVLQIAQAAHNSGGIVMAQVNELLEEPIDPQHVKVPGILVDKIVVADPHEHQQTFAETYNPGYCQAIPNDVSIKDNLEPMARNERRVICARACREIHEGAIANLGIGIPEGIARVAAEKNLLEKFTLTVESGPIGGVPAGGLSFGATLYPQALVDQPSQFDFYDGGGLDFAALGAAQVDKYGNVNVSKFGSKMAGVGGFVNITQNSQKLVFCGTFTTGGLEVKMADGKLEILKEGKIRKFIKNVEQISFSGKRALDIKQQVLYITERAVFKLVDKGIELIEVAPGIDIESDVIGLMDFNPIVNNVNLMPKELFK
ncbi:MAG: acyl CoA:acetate/3-ketoacid CoA transferase [Desulfobacteraceae bacterium 4572_35.1]|nr:MAG: acyl CoA:acetate/3-ketoacid CoA transferase [Desulfobacteraceae bacterium 4572_35.1]